MRAPGAGGVAVVVDSSAQMPTELARRLGVTVVPVHVTIAGRDHREGVDLDADAFWALVGTAPVPPAVTTAQPSPGEFLDTYAALAASGAAAVVSVHVGSAHSGTVNAARLAAVDAPVPVEIVDTGTASFGVSLCAWAAVDALAAGADAATAARVAGEVAGGVGTVFVVGALEVVRRSGRLDAGLAESAADARAAEEVVVFGGTGGSFDVVGTGRSVDELCDVMAGAYAALDRPVRAGVSVADDATIALADGLERRLRRLDGVVEIVRYRVGPSVAAHLGPGTGGGFWMPVPTR